MRIKSLEEITGKEVLAKDIISKTGVILVQEGIIIKKDYIDKLKKLNIKHVYVRDSISEGIEMFDNLELKIKEEFQNNFRDIMIRYINQTTNKATQIEEIASKIIDNVLQNKAIVYSLNSIRLSSERIYSHSLNVCVISVLIGIKLKLTYNILYNLAVASLLHDIGMISLNLEENKELDIEDMKKHVIQGYEFVNEMEGIGNAISEIILKHHERLDGLGFPFKIKGNKINTQARILGVSDDFDSMIYGNYTKKLNVKDALDYMISQADIKYDIKVINALIDSVAAYPTGSLVMTNRGERAIVVSQNIKCPTRPKIRIIAKESNKDTRIKEIDMTKDLTIFIEEVI